MKRLYYYLILCIAFVASSFAVAAQDAQYPETLYLIGDALPNGWDAATPMTKIDNGVYQYTGELKAGNFNILAQDPKATDNWNNAYGLEDKQTINYNGVSNSQIKFFAAKPGGCYYSVESADQYVLTVDLVNGTIDAYADHLFFCGVPSDWKFVEMTNEGNGVFSGRFNFKGADQAFALMFIKEWGPKYQISTDLGKDYVFGLGDFSEKLKYGNTWSLKNETPGYYVITVDMKSHTITTSTYNPNPVEALYVKIGDTYNAMTRQEDNTYKWTGELNSDGFVVTPGEAAYPCYMPLVETQTVPAADTKMLYNISADNNVNNKWSVEEEKSYTVTVNPEAMTLSVEANMGTGIEDIESADTKAPVEYYDLFGRKVLTPSKGLYIRAQGGKTSKVVL